MAEILKTVSGEVLRQNSEAGGNILKSNYNFGLSIGVTSTGYNRLEVNNFPKYETITILQSLFRPSLTSSSQEYRFFDQSNNYVGFNRYISGVPRHQYNSFTTSSFSTGSENVKYVNSVNYFSNGEHVRQFDNGFLTVSRSPIVEPLNIEYAYFWESINFSFGIKIGEIRLYNRFLTNSEISHFHNFGNGNEPLSISGMFIRYIFDSAQILDFSLIQDGSDMRVGIRNYGSIPYLHAEIIGLPAGTLEEKRDWANANLFQVF